MHNNYLVNVALGGLLLSASYHHHIFQNSISKGRFKHFHVIFIFKDSCCSLFIIADYVLLQTVGATKFTIAAHGELGLMIQLSTKGVNIVC
jgi:hypothetical protein